MTFAGRFRIIVLLLLSLVSAVPDVFPDGTGQIMVRAPESIHHENEIPEACKVSLRLETSVREMKRHKQQSFGKTAAIALTAVADIRSGAPLGGRPAYYAFLHRFNLF